MLLKPNIWVFGTSGTGKSSLCNALVIDRTRRTFPETKPSPYSPSTGEVIHQQHVTLRAGQEANLVDTEGFSNPDIPEQTLYDRTYESLKTLKTVDRFVLVFNSAEPRLDIKVQKMISLFVEMVGVYMLNCLSVVYTRWSYDLKAIKTRERQNVSETSKTEEINAFFRSKFSFSKAIDCFFVDCNFEEEDEGANRCVEQLEALIKSFTTAPACQTSNVKTVNVNPVVSYNTYSNTQSGDTYSRKMAERRAIVTKIEAYFDNRDTTITLSLISDISKCFPSSTKSLFPWISKKNYRAYQIKGYLSTKLSEAIQTNLTKVFGIPEIRSTDLNFVDESLRDLKKSIETETLFIDSIIAILFGGTIGHYLLRKFRFRWKIPGLVLISWVARLVTIKICWNPDEVRKQVAQELTQQIAYTNQLKKKTIDLADKILDASD